MLHPRVLVIKILRLFKLNRIAGKIYYNFFHGFNPAGKELPDVIEKCFDKAIEVGNVDNGDYYEFGIFKGFTFAYSFSYAKRKKLDKMTFFGFDSFKGLPEIIGLDITKEMPFYKGQFSAKKEKVIKDISRTNIDWSKAHIIEGFFNQTLNDETKKKYGMNKIAVALIDCDLHSSTVEVLNFIRNMLLDKTIMIFDDWNAFNRDNERGQPKAFNDFLNTNKHISAEEFFSYGAYGKVFIISLEN